MQLVTKRSLIESAAERYRAAHTRRGVWLDMPDGSRPEETYARLAALPPDAGEEAVAAIVGDNRYTTNICDECGQEREVAVHMATEDHHPTDTVTICSVCLGQAMDLVKRA